MPGKVAAAKTVVPLAIRQSRDDLTPFPTARECELGGDSVGMCHRIEVHEFRRSATAGEGAAWMTKFTYSLRAASGT